MRTMKAARLYGPGDLRLMEVPVPQLGPHDVLCAVARCGVCGTDHAIFTGEFSFVREGRVKFPKTLGHEWSGTVVAVGSEVRQHRVGDRVVGDTSVACGQCVACVGGIVNRCRESRSVGTVSDFDGAYAECIVMPERHLFRLPDRVGFDAGAMVEPAATALYAVHKAQAALGSVESALGHAVLVQGSGPIGIMAAKLAKLSGAAKVVIVGRKAAKLRAALAFGADAAIDTSAETVRDGLRRILGEPAVDAVIEASGSTELLAGAASLLRPGGVIAAVAFYERPPERLSVDELVFNDISLVGVAGSLRMYPAVLRLMAEGIFDPTPLITARYPFADVHRALADMGGRGDARIKLMLEM